MLYFEGSYMVFIKCKEADQTVFVFNLEGTSTDITKII